MTSPFQYKIRYSSRAKHLSLRVCAGSGLEVIIPNKKRQYDVEQFIHSHRNWIERQIQKFKIPIISEENAELPNKLELLAIDESIEIVYRPIETAQTISCRFEKNKIVIYGLITDHLAFVPMVVKWLKKQAKVYLKKWLDELSIECKLPYHQLSIRGQRTMWGSCTSRKKIQLNYKILFLPKNTARYILIHELCHTKHLNHSVLFWRMVESFVPDFREHVKKLKTADQFIPRWLT